MLQQTRIDTVIPFFERWLDKLPTIQSVATVDESTLTKLWAGLGYYRRVHMIQKAAQIIVSQHNGELPSNVDQLLKLPGVGQYTAGAISSIAYDRRAALVDGNVIRVFSRLRAIKKPANSPHLQKFCWEIAHEFIKDCEKPAEWNQSLMELGATICIPGKPQCMKCPVSANCHSFQQQRCKKRPFDQRFIPNSTEEECGLCDVEGPPFLAGSYPSAAFKKAALTQNVRVCCVVRHLKDETQFLLVRRPSVGLLANQLEFPCVIVSEDDDEKEMIIQRLSNALSCRVVDLSNGNEQFDFVSRKEIGHIQHVFSHRVHEMKCELLTLRWKETADEKSSPVDSNVHWLTEAELKNSGVTKGVLKVLDLYKQQLGDFKSGPKSAVKKRKITAMETNQRSIMQMFQNQSKVQVVTTRK